MTQAEDSMLRRTAASVFLAPRLSHEQFLALRRFPALDGVRAIAAVMVIAFHTAGPRLAFISGWLGVHLFFVMSGFLITTLLAREESLGGRISLSNFWIRRVFRILPPYYVTLLITLIFLWAGGIAESEGVPQSIGWFLGVSPELAPTSIGFVPAWTIGIEQKFYIVWPVIAFVLVVRRPVRRVLVWVGVLTIVLALALGVTDYFVHFGVILAGCGIALAMHSGRGFAWVRFLSRPIAGVLALAALVAVQVNGAQLQLYFHSQVQLILLYGLCAAALIPSLCSQSWGTTILRWAPLRWLGDRSYSIYLLQVIATWLLYKVYPRPGGLPFFLMELVVVVILAEAMHRLVELPSIRFGKRLITRRALRAGGAQAATLRLGEQPEGGMPRGDVRAEEDPGVDPAVESDAGDPSPEPHGKRGEFPV